MKNRTIVTSAFLLVVLLPLGIYFSRNNAYIWTPHSDKLEDDVTSIDPPSELKPGQKLVFNFPDLPKTLAGRTPIVTLRLPDNYSGSETYPLFIYLDGGQGGGGNNLHRPKAIIGSKDYIIGNFPLFGQSNILEPFNGELISVDNYSTNSAAFQEFLLKIKQTIPNIDQRKSVVGGYSNGANSLAVMLSALDVGLLENFRYIFFIDGGEDWSWNSIARTSKLRRHRFLLIYGGGEPQKTEWWRKHTLNRAVSFQEFAQRWNVDIEVKIVPGYNHGFYKEFYPLIRSWLDRPSSE